MKITTVENIATGKVHTGWFSDLMVHTTCGLRLYQEKFLIKQYIIQPGFSAAELLTCQRCKAVAINLRK
jgi:hypothetical protein